jgi:hypothetical protein
MPYVRFEMTADRHPPAGAPTGTLAKLNVGIDDPERQTVIGIFNLGSSGSDQWHLLSYVFANLKQFEGKNVRIIIQDISDVI